MKYASSHAFEKKRKGRERCGYESYQGWSAGDHLYDLELAHFVTTVILFNTIATLFNIIVTLFCIV
jgi:hypothetical protein